MRSDKGNKTNNGCKKYHKAPRHERNETKWNPYFVILPRTCESLYPFAKKCASVKAGLNWRNWWWIETQSLKTHPQTKQARSVKRTAWTSLLLTSSEVYPSLTWPRPKCVFFRPPHHHLHPLLPPLLFTFLFPSPTSRPRRQVHPAAPPPTKQIPCQFFSFFFYFLSRDVLSQLWWLIVWKMCSCTVGTCTFSLGVCACVRARRAYVCKREGGGGGGACVFQCVFAAQI